jgi:DNA gyrase subunit A
MVITRGGIMIRIALDTVSQQGRNTLGVRIINLKKQDRVGGIAKISQDIAGDEENEVEDGAAAGPTDSTGQPEAPEAE